MGFHRNANECMIRIKTESKPSLLLKEQQDSTSAAILISDNPALLLYSSHINNFLY